METAAEKSTRNTGNRSSAVVQSRAEQSHSLEYGLRNMWLTFGSVMRQSYFFDFFLHSQHSKTHGLDADMIANRVASPIPQCCRRCLRTEWLSNQGIYCKGRQRWQYLDMDVDRPGLVPSHVRTISDIRRECSGPPRCGPARLERVSPALSMYIP